MNEQTELELIPIDLKEIPPIFKKEWRKLLMKERSVIADTTLVGPSKILNGKYPICITLVNAEYFTLIFKFNVTSKIMADQKVETNRVFYLSRANWKKELV
jgi:hypothetical protein